MIGRSRAAPGQDNPDLVAKAATSMGLKVYKTSNPEVAALAQKLPVGRLYANGRGFVGNNQARSV